MVEVDPGKFKLEEPQLNVNSLDSGYAEVVAPDDFRSDPFGSQDHPEASLTVHFEVGYNHNPKIFAAVIAACTAREAQLKSPPAIATP